MKTLVLSRPGISWTVSTPRPGTTPKIPPLIQEHMSHSPGGKDETPSDTAVRRLVRRLDHASGGPSLKEWTRIVEADKGGRGDGDGGGPEKAGRWLKLQPASMLKPPRPGSC